MPLAAILVTVQFLLLFLVHSINITDGSGPCAPGNTTAVLVAPVASFVSVRAETATSPTEPFCKFRGLRIRHESELPTRFNTTQIPPAT